MANDRIRDYASQLRAAQGRFVAAVEQASEAALRERPDDDEWSIAQVVGHVTEVQPFWLRKARSLGTRFPEPLSRTMEEHEARDAAVALAQQRTREQLLASLRQANAAALELLEAMDDQLLDESGPRWDGQLVTAEQVVRQFVVAHVEEHASQVEALLGERSAAG